MDIVSVEVQLVDEDKMPWSRWIKESAIVATSGTSRRPSFRFVHQAAFVLCNGAPGMRGWPLPPPREASSHFCLKSEQLG